MKDTIYEREKSEEYIGTKLKIPCSYQGGKQRLAKQIVDIFYEENRIDDNTKFFDLCCGSGSISLELINRGFNPNNIAMTDSGCFGQFWQDIANDEFELDVFRNEIDKLPSIEHIQNYLKELSSLPVNNEKISYHYLLLQAGAFGSKQIWIENHKWKNNTFRNYWLPTANSNRRSPVNPMMPMSETLFSRVKNIVEQLSGCIVASQEDIFQSIDRIIYERTLNSNVIVYIDPPYQNTTGYKETFNIENVIKKISCFDFPVYISEGYKMDSACKTYLLSKGRTKGNISGEVKKKPVEEWLNRF